MLILILGSLVFLVVMLSGKAPTPSVEVGLVFTYVLILAGFATLPILWDLQKAYALREATESGQINKLIDAAAKDGLTGEELRILIDEIRESPKGVTGLGRQTMALAILVLLGIVVFHALVFGVPDVSKDLVKSVADVLGGAVSAIIGFYYGAKKLEEATTPAAPKAEAVEKKRMTAQIKASPTKGDKPLAVDFLVVVLQGELPVKAEWDFDDATSHAEGLAVKHTYEKAGRFTPSVKVRDREGSLAFDAVLIEVTEKKE